MYWYVSNISSDIYIVNSEYLSSDVRIRGYFSKPKGGPRAEKFGETLI